MNPDNIPWLVCVTTDDGSNESGNIHYIDIHVYPDRDSALAAARGAFGSGKYKEEVYPQTGCADFTDSTDNWLLVRPADVAPVTLQYEPEDEVEDEEPDDAGPAPAVRVCCNTFFGFLDEEMKP